MRRPPLILIADDNEANRDILARRLEANGYELVMAADGEEALALARGKLPDLILLDVMMPKVDGLEVCRQLKGDRDLPFIPIILVTARADTKDIVRGLEMGGDEYVTKPVDQAALVARVRSTLRIKDLHDTVHEQSKRLAAQADELAQWNDTLKQRVTDQLAEIERTSLDYYATIRSLYRQRRAALIRHEKEQNLPPPASFSRNDNPRAGPGVAVISEAKTAPEVSR